MTTNRPNHAVLALLLVGILFGGEAASAQRSYYPGGGSSKVRVPDDLGREPLEVAKTALGGGDKETAAEAYGQLASTWAAADPGRDLDEVRGFQAGTRVAVKP